MKIVTPEQMRKIDSYTINEVGIPGMVLMENAASAVVNQIVKGFDSVKGRKICIFAGKGNNGGDAFAVARHLHNKGAKINIFITASKEDIKGDALLNLRILDRMDIKTYEILSDGDFKKAIDRLKGAELIVDGIFGTGIRGRIGGYTASIIKVLNQSGVPIFSIDIPSGVNGGTGEIHGECVKANKTITFAYPKFGHHIYPGCEYTGELLVRDIGIPPYVAKKLEIKTNIISKGMVSALMPKRVQNSNKGDYGRVLIVTGSRGMTGAGCLAGMAALRTGTGLLYLGVPSSLSDIYEHNLIESITLSLEDEGTGILSKRCLPKLLGKCEGMNAILVGPGLSVKGDVKEIVEAIIKDMSKPLVLDADALNALPQDKTILKKYKGQMVLTPHPGEMARLLGTTVSTVQANRIGVAREFSKRWGVITVLKGFGTIVALPDGELFINTTGNSSLATAGTGDVLSGMIAGFIGQGLPPRDAAIISVYLHGLCGEEIAKKRGEHGLVASELAEGLSYTMKELIKD